MERYSGVLTAPVKLNLGAGGKPLDGYDNGYDLTSGGANAYPLEVPDASVDEIRASHIFEHFSHRAAADVLKDWVRALKPGGILKIAVPDFEKCVELYHQGHGGRALGYICGGHVDKNDVHLAQYDYKSLRALMNLAGLSGVHKWAGDGGDSSTLPISLNLAGYKLGPMPKIMAVMSVPRLGFMDNFFSAIETVAKLRIPIQKTTGVFWGQCMTRSIEEVIERGAEWVLTFDYDTVYEPQTVLDMIATATMNPGVDALVPLQMHRRGDHPILVMPDDDGNPATVLDRSKLDATIVPILSGHFGCTLLRASAFARMEKPWFIATTDQKGGWGDGHVDDDITFWRRWRAAGNGLHLASRIAVGHADLYVMWPDVNLQLKLQRPPDYWKEGPPRELWE